MLDLISQSLVNVTAVEELYPIDDAHIQSKLSNLISDKHMSSRAVRKLVKSIGSKKHNSDFIFRQSTSECDRIYKSFDKLIIALRIAIKKLTTLIEKVEDNWMIYNVMMQHKHMLHQQIDLVIKEKIKYKKNYLCFRTIN